MSNSLNTLLEIKLKVDPQVIEETLTRMGIPDFKHNVVYQSCHLLKQFDTYYLGHFKQLFVMARGKDGYHGFGNVSMEDIQRRNTIAYYLEQWNMIEIVNKEQIEDHKVKIFTLPYKEKHKWQLVRKFNVKNLELA